MKKFICSFLLLFFLINSYSVKAQKANAEQMKWFKEAKLGIFIHWGIYSVNGIDESWSFFNGYISYDDYMKQLDGFTAKKYKPADWAKLIKKSGAKYAVITAKHHDGVALWPTTQSDLNVVAKTPAGRDLIGPLVKDLRSNNLKVGLYFSHLDWSYSDYPRKTREEYRYHDNSARWDNFLGFRFNQIKELVIQYNPDLLWFDGDWEEKPEMWQSEALRDSIKKWSPDIIINSRINGFGDYATPEQGVPVEKPQDDYWELCMTMNDSWGYQANDTHYKSTDEIIRIYADMIGMGGNLLLGIGPKDDGTVPDEQKLRLLELGRWAEKHAPAIYSTHSGLPPGLFYGSSTLSVDSTILYLFLPTKATGPYQLKGIKNKIQRMWVVGDGTKLESREYGKMYWSETPGTIFFDVPEKSLDKNMTVVAVLLKGKLNLFQSN